MAEISCFAFEKGGTVMKKDLLEVVGQDRVRFQAGSVCIITSWQPSYKQDEWIKIYLSKISQFCDFVSMGCFQILSKVVAK